MLFSESVIVNTHVITTRVKKENSAESLEALSVSPKANILPTHNHESDFKVASLYFHNFQTVQFNFSHFEFYTNGIIHYVFLIFYFSVNIYTCPSMQLQPNKFYLYIINNDTASILMHVYWYPEVGLLNPKMPVFQFPR